MTEKKNKTKQNKTLIFHITLEVHTSWTRSQRQFGDRNGHFSIPRSQGYTLVTFTYNNKFHFDQSEVGSIPVFSRK